MSQANQDVILRTYTQAAERINHMGKFRALKIKDSKVDGLDSVFERDGESVVVYTSYGSVKMQPSAYTELFDAKMREVKMFSDVAGDALRLSMVDERDQRIVGMEGDYVVFVYAEDGVTIDFTTIVRGYIFEMMTKFDPNVVSVDMKALHTVLRAVTGPGHHIRELQATRSISQLVGEDHPFDVLTGQYEAHRAGVEVMNATINEGLDAQGDSAGSTEGL